MISTFFIAFILSYVGLIAPGMLNMTACKISVEKGSREALQFSIGASLIVIVQAYIALTFAKLLTNNPAIIENFKIAGIVVFFALSIFFYAQTQKRTKSKSIKKHKKGNSFLIGMGLSIANALAIPFYLTIGVYSEQEGYLRMVLSDKILFVLGASLGVFLLLRTYCKYALIILTKSKLLAKYSNYILSGLFLILGIFTLAHVIN